MEDNLPWLSKKTVAYLNVDVATSGQHLTASASPLLNDAIHKAASLVRSPNQTVEGQTVLDVWGGHIKSMGSGSDFTAFQDFAGIPSVDCGFTRGKNDSVYHYHSNYDSFHWMDNYGDANWTYHVAATKIWSLIAANLIENPVLAFKAHDYAKGLKQYLDSTKSKVPENDNFNFDDLEDAIAEFLEATVEFDEYTGILSERLEEDIPWWQYWRKIRLFFEIRAANGKIKLLERKFLHADGLDGRSWYKHVVFAPGLWTGYSGATFPGLVESFEAGDLDNAKKWSDIIVGKLKNATASIR